MIEWKILEDEGIVVVRPKGPLSEADFRELGVAVDAYLGDDNSLRGLVIQVKAFPGWESFGGLIQHIRFVKEHHSRIGKVALVTDSALASFAPQVAEHFVRAEVKAFEYEGLEAALDWIRSG